jgi:hypothetical protein
MTPTLFRNAMRPVFLGLSSVHKCTADLHLLAYNTTGDAVDEYCRLSDSTAMEAMRRFVWAIRACFEATYLREPTCEDIVRQMDINEKRGSHACSHPLTVCTGLGKIAQ